MNYRRVNWRWVCHSANAVADTQESLAKRRMSNDVWVSQSILVHILSRDSPCSPRNWSHVRCWEEVQLLKLHLILSIPSSPILCLVVLFSFFCCTRCNASLLLVFLMKYLSSPQKKKKKKKHYSYTTLLYITSTLVHTKYLHTSITCTRLPNTYWARRAHHPN